MGKGFPMRRLALLAALLLLASCGSETESIDDVSIAKRIISQKTTGKAGAAAAPAITRELLDSIGKPLLRAKVENTGAVAVLGLIGQNGNAVTWTSADAISLTLRDGIVVATRGLGDDLISAAVPALAAVYQGQGLEQRRLYSLEGGDTEVMRPYDCSLSVKGTESLVLYGIGYTVRHVVEACRGPAGTFQNDYWMEVGGKMRQSRQWIGEQVGFLELQLVSR